MDKTFFKKQSQKEAEQHQLYYNTLSEEEKALAFFMMMQAAYGFTGQDWPRMEKVYSGKRKLSAK